MQIGSGNPKNQYLFGGVPLRSVDSEKDLGVVFDSAFKFDDHVGGGTTVHFVPAQKKLKKDKDKMDKRDKKR